MNTFTGCSGFHYDHWKGSFYPERLPKNKWLSFYAEHFKTVEINHSFYKLPKVETLQKWHRETPDSFRFTMKGSRYISHMKKIVDDEDVREGLQRFYKIVSELKEKLGCVLWQLPGNQHRDDEKLKNFCTLLSDRFNNVLEFRHTSWFTEPVFNILENQGVGYCVISAPEDLPELTRVTTDVGYVRFHGKKEWYRYDYSDKELHEWSNNIKQMNARDIYIYFNNDAEAFAVKNALKIKEKLKEK